MEDFARPKIKKPTDKRLETELFPPGQYIHFYRDGVGISATYSPPTFFNELEVRRTSLTDHLIVTGYPRIFLEIMRQQYKDDNFCFPVAIVASEPNDESEEE
jgi:hypothetical protein